MSLVGNMGNSSATTSLGHMPHGPWTFDHAVTDVFDDMLRRSVPQYGAMRELVFSMGITHVKPGTRVVDLGCSKGEGLGRFIEALGSANTYIGVDNADPMVEAARSRFQIEIEKGFVDIRNLDLRWDYPDGEASLTLSVLSLQFVPVEYRQQVLHRACSNTVPGGAFILVEKVMGASAALHSQMVAQYHAMKRHSGYSQEEIERKRDSLEGVLVPLKASWNEELLLHAGFREVDCFWRCINFCGWIACK